MLQLQVGLALQAVDLTVASERKADVEVTPEAAQEFTQFWQVHAGCPLLGRNKVRRGSASLHSCVLLWCNVFCCSTSSSLLSCFATPLPPSHHPQIVASVCPELHGLFNVKLATLLMLVGGVTRQDASGAHIRGEVHMLLVGDPGTGQPCPIQLPRLAAAGPCAGPLPSICMAGSRAWDSRPLQLHCTACLAADAAPLPLTCCLPALRMRCCHLSSTFVQARASSKSM
jgi:hypothetical protein